MLRIFSRYLALLSLALSGAIALAGAPQPRVSLPSDEMQLGELPRTKPHLALVLSGGGARGAAHIGVLKVLEENHIVPDLIVGTSMGSIVGGLYAAGYSAEEIEDILATIDWDQVFFDSVSRRQRSFRRKQDDQPYVVPLKLRFKGLKPYLPGGLLGGQKLELLMRDLVAHATDERDFDDLPIPFRAVAMDLATSEPVVLGRGHLADAMRASMSIPAAFTPVVIDGRHLVDGGSAANLPVRVAQRLGAERIIAVNISTPSGTEVEGLSFFGVLTQLTGFLTAGSVTADLEALRDTDLLITPPLGDLSFKDFDRAREAVGIGEAAAREQVAELREFSADEARWNEFRRRHRRDDTTRYPVAEVSLDNTSWVDDRVVQRRLDIPRGQPLDSDELRRQLVELSGLEYFGVIETDLKVEDEQSRLRITTPKRAYGRGSLQFGLSLRSDFEGDAGYALLARHRVLAVNPRGGEWLNTVQIGDTSVLASEFYQPLDWGMHWFVEPAFDIRRDTLSIWIDGTRAVDYRTDNKDVSVDLGRVLGKWGEVRVGMFRGESTGDPRIALPGFPSFDEQTGGVTGRLSVDTLDLPVFPHAGAQGRALIERNLDAFGADENATFVAVSGYQAIPFGKSTIVPRFDVSADLSGEFTLRSVTKVGGLLRLSGLGENELLGDRGGVFGLLYYYELTGISLGPIGNRVFAGVSLEGGNAYLPDEAIDAPSLLFAGSVFLSAATPLGPAYLAWGWAEPDRQRYYFLIGDRF